MLFTQNFLTRSASLIISFFITTLLFVVLSNSALAQSDAAGVGIRPAIFNEKMDPGEVKQFSMQVQNLSEIDQIYFFSKRDILGAKEGGVPIFANKTAEKTEYQLSEWITLENSEVFISARGSYTLNFVLQVPLEVSPGSHFGGIIISVEPPEIRSSGASIGYEVANIISIRVSGDAIDLAKIRQFSTSQYIYGKTDVDFEVRVENEGNTLLTPVGPLEIYNMFGKKVQTLQFNESFGGVYPKTAASAGLRTFYLSWKDEGVGFGRYEAIVSLVYGDEGKKNTISSTASFWILPMNIIGPAVGALVILLLIIYVGVKLYVRRSMAMLSTGSARRLVRSRQQGQFPVMLLIVSMLAVTSLFLIVLLLLFA